MKLLDVYQIVESFNNAPSMSLGRDFFIMDINYKDEEMPRLVYPCKFDGLVCMYCLSGEFSLTIGFDEFDVSRDCFAVALPGDIVSFYKKDSDMLGSIRVMAISNDFLREMNFDLLRARTFFECRMVKANKRYKVMIYNYRNIFRSVILTPREETRKSLGHLLRSMNIEMSYIWKDLAVQSETIKPRDQLTSRFLSLVSVNHVQHRDLEFYASTLSITPKYLSSAVKKASGQSAVEWIAAYVVLEAKYYLANTDLKIKEIAYSLHFSNQIDFYRFFQRQTGKTPTQYRNSMKAV